MRHFARTHGLAATLAAATFLAACGSSDAPSDGSNPTGPSGSVGVVTVEAAGAAVRGLCEIHSELSSDLEAANAAFFNEAHEELHVIAAATEVVDRAAAGRLLVAKERVESDLARSHLPDSFVPDVAELIGATLAALEAIDVDVPACPA